MLIIRPVETSDIDQLLILAKKVAPGITTFPPNKEVLEQKIVDSKKGFSGNPSIDCSDDCDQIKAKNGQSVRFCIDHGSETSISY